MALHLHIALLYYVLMKLNKYLEITKTNQCDFAEQMNVSNGMVNQWVNGTRPIAPHQCVLIEKLTDGKVTRKDLHPDDWFDIWPELAKAA
ncbi:MAG TPA: YdaS family helix-turn-helix protein [Methylotenera sp.]|nr:YdaS family helix-turn-helix protein [Methylotenera sp.]